MNDLFLRQVMSAAIFGLPAGVLAFAVACFILGFWKPRPTLKDGIIAFVAGVLAYTLAAPFVSQTPSEFQENGIKTVMAVMFVVAGGVMLWRRQKRIG